MGYTFSNLHIRKGGRFDEAAAADYFRARFREQGYLPAAAPEDADVTLYVASLPDSGWISVYTDAFDLFDPSAIPGVAAPLSRAAEADVLIIAGFDSDYLFLNLIRASDRTDAWAHVGRSRGLGIRRLQNLRAWSRHVSDPAAFRACLKRRYICVEEVLEPLAPILSLPYAQSMASAEQPEPPEGELPLRRFFFTLPADRRGAPAEPPRLTQVCRENMPCRAEMPAIVSAVNRGGASRGLMVVFTGPYVETEEITFSEVQLLYGADPSTGTDIMLEKRRLSDGTWAYCGTLPAFRIPERVDPRLPLLRLAREELKRGFTLRFIPHGNPRKMLDIAVRLVPLCAPEGQTCWCVWSEAGSKAAYIEQYNRHLRTSHLPPEHFPPLDPEAYDLD